MRVSLPAGPAISQCPSAHCRLVTALSGSAPSSLCMVARKVSGLCKPVLMTVSEHDSGAVSDGRNTLWVAPLRQRLSVWRRLSAVLSPDQIWTRAAGEAHTLARYGGPSRKAAISRDRLDSPSVELAAALASLAWSNSVSRQSCL